MSGKQLDEQIRAMLENHQVPFEPEHWDQFEQEYGDSLEGGDLLGDDMIDSLKQFEAEPIPGDWDVLSSMLDREDGLEGKEFDSEIRKTVDRFEAPYEENTWPILERKLTQAEIRRRRIIVSKVLEIAAVLMLLFTFYNFYPGIRDGLFNKPGKGQEKAVLAADGDVQEAGRMIPGAYNESTASTHPGNQVPDAGLQSAEVADAVIPAYNSADQYTANRRSKPTIPYLAALRAQVLENTLAGGSNTGVAFNVEPLFQSNELHSPVGSEDENAGMEARNAVDPGSMDLIPSLPLKLHVPLFNNPAHQKLYGAIHPATGAKTSKRVGIYASAGVNVLHFPADNFFSGGEQITFQAQDLPALGYGGGISMGWYGRRLGFETGIQYSNKSFKPGRQLLVGESLENSKVDFQAVQIDLVTIPLTLTYQIKPQGNMRFYALGGLGFNIIAQAHYDLQIENNYPLPLSITQSASALASNREAHRIREHILDGATFKSKTHVTAILGFGMENYISHNLSLFVQPAYAHQIPLNRFSNNNGKNFKNLNIRIGARTTIN